MKVFDRKKSAGRSMTEVLTVLAIVGILSLASFAGITMLFRKNRANDAFDDLQRTKLEVLARSDAADLEIGKKVELDGLKDLHYKVEAHRIDEVQNNGAMFEIEISDIDRKTCVELLKKPFDTPFKISVDGREFDPEHPDFTVCDVFDEARSNWFISSAYAIVINTGKNSTIKYKITSKSPEKNCKKSGGQWINGSTCCPKGSSVAHPLPTVKDSGNVCCPASKKVKSIGSVSACCDENAKVYLKNGTTAECCNGNVYKDSKGREFCCASPSAVVGVVGENCGRSDGWCCPSGNIAYCEVDGKNPMCCQGQVVTVQNKRYCCKAGLEPMDVKGASNGSQFCCDVGRPYLTDNGPQCCDGTPYEALYTQDSKGKGFQCCEVGKEAVSVAGLGSGYQACCEPGQVAYIDGDVQRCCSTELVYNEKTKTYSCDKCSSEEKKVDVTGAPAGKTAELCCSTKTFGSNPKAYWAGSTAKCCSGEVYVLSFAEKYIKLSSVSRRFDGYDQSKPIYECCSGEGNKVVDLLSSDTRITGWKYCCPNGQNAFWDGYSQKRVCCDEDKIAKGFPYGGRVDGGYRCCGSNQHAVDVEGKDYQACCNEGETSAIEFNQCCPKGTAAFDCAGVKKCLVTDIDKICSNQVSSEYGMSGCDCDPHLYPEDRERCLRECTKKLNPYSSIKSDNYPELEYANPYAYNPYNPYNPYNLYGYTSNPYESQEYVEGSFCLDYEEWISCVRDSGICDIGR